MDYKSFDLKYTISVTFEDVSNGKFVTFEKFIERKDVKLTSKKATFIEIINIEECVKENKQDYCIENHVNPKSMLVDSYEIIGTNDNIYMYFSVEDMAKFSLEPGLYAIINLTKAKPTLEAKQINENTVKWTWSWEGAEEYTSELHSNFRGHDVVIAHTPIGVSEFIEAGIDRKIEPLVTRFIIVKKGDIEVASIPISINLKDESSISIFRKFQKPKRRDDYKVENVGVANRMSAFQSGIGFGKDCKVLKPDTIEYDKIFKLMNKVYGIRASKKIKYNTVKFFYRYMLKGKVNYLGYKGSFKIKGRAILVPDEEFEPTDEEYGDVIYSIPNLEYIFDDRTFVSDIFMNDIFGNLHEGFHNARYKFYIEIYDINGDMEIYSPVYGVNRIVKGKNETIKFSFKGLSESRMSVKATPIEKSRDYIEMYPPINFEPLVGAVNGDFEVSESGKKNMKSKMPEFDMPKEVYDKKYYCVIDCDKTLPKEGCVQFKFKSQEEGGYTLTNGDECTFYCDTIIEDETEYREFVTQVDIGGYSINDNRKHNYRYKVNLNSIDHTKYKRFEIDIESDINDINVLESDVNYTVIDKGVICDVRVAARALQGAVAKWSPFIESGFYYLNQDEFFLYNKGCITGGDVDSNQFCFKSIVTSRVVFNVKGGDGKYKKFKFESKSKEDLLTDPSNFIFNNGLIYPKPIRDYDDFQEYKAEYAFYSKPFICEIEPTKILNIMSKKITGKYTSLDVYAVSYNDVYGEWREPVLIKDEIPKELKMSKIMMLKVVFKPSRLPKIRSRHYSYNSEGAWKNWINKSLSYNVKFKKDRLEQISKFTKGHLVSNIHDLGDSAERIKRRSIMVDLPMQSANNIKIYYQHGSDYEKIDNSMDISKWNEMELGKEYKVERFVRFRVEIKGGGIIKSLYVTLNKYEYTGMDIKEYLPMLGDISIDAEYNPDEFIKVINFMKSMELPFDMIEYPLIENLKEFTEKVGAENNFKSQDVVGIDFVKVGRFSDDYDIIYSRNKADPIIANKPVIVKSTRSIEDIELKDNNQCGVLVTPQSGKFIEVSPIPQQFSPIIIQEEDENGMIIIPYRQVYFLKKENEFGLDNVEEFESLGFKTIYLKNINIDETSTTVRVNGNLVENYKLETNVLIFDEEIPKGDTISVTYRIKNSFAINYDYENDKVLISLHGEDFYHKIKKVRIFYETSKDSRLRELKHIALNPIHNPSYGGYIYISDEVQEPFECSIVIGDNMVYANGLDTTNVLVLVKDKYGNPIENINVRAIVGLGKLDKEEKATDINGIARFIYTSYVGDCIDKVVVSVTSGVRASAEIINRKVIMNN